MTQGAIRLSESEGEVIRLAGDRLAPVALALRDLILSVHADAHILAWPRLRIISFGLGPRKMEEHYVFIAVHAGHVNLGLYHGAALDCPGMPLAGTGKTLRHIKVRSPQEILAPAFRALVHRALEHQRQLIRS